MGKPCGCAGSCGCDIRGRNGIKVTGTGIAPDTLWIELDGSSPNACATIMDCVGGNLGSGLSYNAALRRLSVRISNTAGNLVSFGTDGGLLVTGGGGGGGAGGQTVANLPAGINAIIGSTWGAGSAMWPEGSRESIEAARNLTALGIRMVHVPVRCTRDEMAVCLAEPSMGWYMNDGNTFTPRQFDHREHSAITIAPGGNPVSSAESGYWGFYEPPSKGSPGLGDMFAALARRVVIVAEVRDTISPLNAADRIKLMAPQFDVQSSLIVAGEPVPATGTYPTIIEGVSASISGSGIPIGVVFRTRQQVIDFPASRLATLGVSWVFMTQNLVDPFDSQYAAGAAEAYRSAGLNVMLTWVARQYQKDRAAALQLRGSLCIDPLYAYGSTSGYGYRRDDASWGFSYVNVGQHSPWSNTVIGQQAHYRGFVIAGEPGVLTLPADLRNPEQVEPYPSGYWMLPGEMLPLRNANTYAIQTYFQWTSLPVDRGRWAGIFFDCPTDRSIRDWSGATAQTVGYLLVMSVGSGTSTFSLVEYDGTPGQPPEARVLMTATVGYSIAPGFWYGIRAEVTPTQIRVYASSSPWPNPFTKVLVGTINNPHRYINGVNNGHFFFGRHFFNQGDSRVVKVAGLRVDYSGF